MDGVRITLERDGWTPFAITCGIYGWMVHSCFFGTRREAELEYETMKGELSGILDIIPWEDDPDTENKLGPVSEAIEEFVERHL